MTAFVVKSFAQAHKLNLIFIDNNVVEKAVKFILDNQLPTGAFNNVGVVSNKGLQVCLSNCSKTTLMSDKSF